MGDKINKSLSDLKRAGSLGNQKSEFNGQRNNLDFDSNSEKSEHMYRMNKSAILRMKG